ncbi:MAG: RNA polymerase sporulation sigma factor SigE [Clostridia bacterium]|nr:RNA polymerase sporulation sigma factor SigE [Clostridia bacterium]
MILLISLLKKEEGVYYIGTAYPLPPPLNLREEELLLKKLKEGSAKAKEELIERNLRLVIYIARKFENTGVGTEDLVSIGSIGLIKAINTFDSDKNIKLATYASRCIENEILMYLRKTGNQRAEISLDEPLNTDWDGNDLLLSELLGTDDDVVNKNIEIKTEHKMLLDAVGRLGKRERIIMNLRFGLDGSEEKTQKEVADLLGISQSYISRLEKRILEKLKKDIIKLS